MKCDTCRDNADTVHHITIHNIYSARVCRLCADKIWVYACNINPKPVPISFTLAVEQVRKGKQFEVFGHETRKGILTKIAHSTMETQDLYYFETEGSEFRFTEREAVFFLSDYKWIEVKS